MIYLIFTIFWTFFSYNVYIFIKTYEFLNEIFMKFFF